MVNRYYTPAKLDFVDTYVPIPFQELLAAQRLADEREERAYNRSEKLRNEFDTLYNNWKKFTSPSTVDTARYHELTINSDATKAYVDKFMQDPNYANTAEGRAALANLKYQMDTPEVRKIVANAPLLAENLKIQADLRSKGLDMWGYEDIANYNTEARGLLTTVPVVRKSMPQLAKEYVDNMEKTFLPDEGDGFIRHGITADRIEQIIDGNYESIMSSDQIQRYIDMYEKDWMGKYAANDPDAVRIANDADFGETPQERLRAQAEYQAYQEFVTAAREKEHIAAVRDPAYTKGIGGGGGGNNDNTNPLNTYASRLAIPQMEQRAVNLNEYVTDDVYKNYKQEGSKLTGQMGNLAKQLSDLQTRLAKLDPQSAEAEQVSSEIALVEESQKDLLNEQALYNVYGAEWAMLNAIFSKDTGITYENPTDTETVEQATTETVLVDDPYGGMPVLYERTVTPAETVKKYMDKNNMFVNNKNIDIKNNTYDNSKYELAWQKGLDKSMTKASPQWMAVMLDYYLDAGGANVRENYSSGKNGYHIDGMDVMSPVQALMYMNPLMAKKAQQAGITNPNGLSRKDINVEDAIRTGQIQNVRMGEAYGYKIMRDQSSGATFIAIQAYADVPQAEMESEFDTSNSYWPSTVKNHGWKILPKDDAASEGYVRIPVVFYRSFSDQDITTINRMYEQRFGTATTLKDVAETSDAAETRVKGTNVYNQYGINPTE